MSGRQMGPDAPPPVTIRFFDESAELHAWSYCYDTGCADGAPPEDLVDVGSPEEIVVEFPLDDWSFSAFFTPSGKKCGRVQRTPLEPLGDGRFVLRPAGYAGTYDVDLWGRGGGDLSTTFRWTTPFDGPLPKPKARAAVLAGDDDEVLSYGVELSVSNLAADPKRASARITVTASNGESLAFDVEPSRFGCQPEGSLYWDRPDDAGQAAVQLGEPPFTYEVELMLDGKRYFARATWPDDEFRNFAPSVPLHFRPALPALQP